MQKENVLCRTILGLHNHLRELPYLMQASSHSLFFDTIVHWYSVPAPLNYRYMQMSKTQALVKSQQSYKAILPLNVEVIQGLIWWIRNLSIWNGKYLSVFFNTVCLVFLLT